ncbi:MAG: type II toxin-antitoxin system VapC family toxin [Actinomycetes bacterium]
MIVLDASALVDVLLDQPERGWVLDQVAGEEIFAPAHQLPEVLSALARLARAGVLSHVQQEEALEEALGLPQEHVVSTAAHLHRALALQDRLPVLDGLYVALSEERGCALVTTDRRLGRAPTSCEVRAPDSRG